MGTMTGVPSMESRNLKRPVALCLAVSVAGGWRTECGVQHQRTQNTAEAKAENITEDRKRCFPLVCCLSSRDETPTGAGERGCLQHCDCSLRTLCH
ncbi:hypothetical protein LEMLEM_LOCUS25419, partial [Lemmus lemmus]